MELNLTNKVNAKKNVDVNDSRYQLSDKLRATSTKSIRQTFTIYDNKDESSVSSNELAAAYALSDKKIPVGELLTKMTDLIVDLSDGHLDSDDDAIRAWKYARALSIIYADKKKRGETMTVFDNSLKNAVINCPTFVSKYPGKYTLQTNFYDTKVLNGLVEDIVETFEEDTVPKIHVAAMKQSRESAEAHKNPTLDKIVQWAMQKYNCTQEAFYDINDDPDTGLKYATNTVILHLPNGYDMSIIGYTGTEHDSQFSISLFNSNDSQINFSAEKCSMEDLRRKLTEASGMDAISPITRMIKIEEAKNGVLREQYEILKNVRPMIPAEYLEMESAESVVGHDYIWGCQNYRMTHEDLPADFTLSQIKLPEFDESMIDEDNSAVADIVGAFATAEGEKKNVNQTGFAKSNAGEILELEDSDPTEMEKESRSFIKSTLLPGADLVTPEKRPTGPSVTAAASAAAAQKKPIFTDAPMPTIPVQKEEPVQQPVAPTPAVEAPMATTLPTMSDIPVVTQPAPQPQPVQAPVFDTGLPTMPTMAQPAPAPAQASVQPAKEVQFTGVQLPQTETPVQPAKPEPVPQPAAPTPAPIEHGDIEDLFA